MSDDFKITVISWSGCLSELAVNFGMDPRELTTQLRRLSTAPPANGRLVLKLDSPQALRTLRHRLKVAEQQSHGDSP